MLFLMAFYDVSTQIRVTLNFNRVNPLYIFTLWLDDSLLTVRQ